jgi:hypothetical protein
MPGFFVVLAFRKICRCSNGHYDSHLKYGNRSNLDVGIVLCIGALIDFGFTDCGYL